MTTNDRIEAEVAAEVKRIEWWDEVHGGIFTPFAPASSLARYLITVRDDARDAARDAQHKRLVEAAQQAIWVLDTDPTQVAAAELPQHFANLTNAFSELRAALKEAKP